MTMSVPALKVDLDKINYNLQNGFVAPGEKVDGDTGTNYNGLGVKDNRSSSEDIAAFFAPYAKETPDTYFQQIDIFNEKGQLFLQDLATFTGDDGYISQEEMEAWAKKNQFKGETNDVMQALAQLDEQLFGKGTIEYEQVDPSQFEETQSTEATDPTEETTPDNTEVPEDKEDEQTSLWDVVTGAVKGLWSAQMDAVKGLWQVIIG